MITQPDVKYLTVNIRPAEFTRLTNLMLEKGYELFYGNSQHEVMVKIIGDPAQFQSKFYQDICLPDWKPIRISTPKSIPLPSGT